MHRTRFREQPQMEVFLSPFLKGGCHTTFEENDNYFSLWVSATLFRPALRPLGFEVPGSDKPSTVDKSESLYFCLRFYLSFLCEHDQLPGFSMR